MATRRARSATVMDRKDMSRASIPRSLCGRIEAEALPSGASLPYLASFRQPDGGPLRVQVDPPVERPGHLDARVPRELPHPARTWDDLQKPVSEAGPALTDETDQQPLKALHLLQPGSPLFAGAARDCGWDAPRQPIVVEEETDTPSGNNSRGPCPRPVIDIEFHGPCVLGQIAQRESRFTWLELRKDSGPGTMLRVVSPNDLPSFMPLDVKLTGAEVERSVVVGQKELPTLR